MTAPLPPKPVNLPAEPPLTRMSNELTSLRASANKLARAQNVLGEIHFFEEFADTDDIVGDSAEVRVIGVVAEGHEDDPWVGRGLVWRRWQRG
jgi:hypothetical protein